MRTEATIVVRGRTEAPILSVLTPFHRDDPSPLLAALTPAPAGIEFILLDDGSGDAALLSRVVSACAQAGTTARIIVLARNQGRAAARNRLALAARGAYVLFLDADMRPDHPRFLSRWLNLIEAKHPHAAFGGLSLRHARRTPATALHFDLFAHSDCRNAAARTAAPAQYVSTANLLVHRDLLAKLPFDATFNGWGFEDVDWALRASALAPMLHVDNTASHVGLDGVETLLRKSAQAGPNFARLVAKHPRATSRFVAYKVARLLRWAPARTSLRTACAAVAKLGCAPPTLRRAALKLFRAMHYAEHLP